MNINKLCISLFNDVLEMSISENNPAFVYTENRKFNILCLIFKISGFLFYSRTAIICIDDKLFPWFCMVSLIMCVSICNTLRYEYAFYNIYGITFQSMDAFKEWKSQQNPHIKQILDFVEFIIKVIFFYKNFPLSFDMYDDDKDNKKFSECRFSGSLLKVHILFIMGIYVVGALIFMFIYIDIALRLLFSPRQPRAPEILNNAVNPINALVVIDNQTECCICLDKNESPWMTARCAHSFHAECLTEWMKRNPSCPVCRTLISTI